MKIKRLLGWKQFPHSAHFSVSDFQSFLNNIRNMLKDAEQTKSIPFLNNKVNISLAKNAVSSIICRLIDSFFALTT